MRPERFEAFHIEPFYIENVLGRAKIFNIPIGGAPKFESFSFLLKLKFPCLSMSLLVLAVDFDFS